MKEMLRYGFILALICLVASGLLATVNSLAKGKILAQVKLEEEASLREVIPEAESFQPVKHGEEIIYYQAVDKKGRPTAVVFKATNKGYSSAIETMVGMEKNGTIIAVKVLNQNETPGLGNRILQPSFTGQFTAKNIQRLDEVQAIAGATISSRAVLDSVKKKAEEIKGLIENEE